MDDMELAQALRVANRDLRTELAHAPPRDHGPIRKAIAENSAALADLDRRLSPVRRLG